MVGGIVLVLILIAAVTTPSPQGAAPARHQEGPSEAQSEPREYAPIPFPTGKVYNKERHLWEPAPPAREEPKRTIVGMGEWITVGAVRWRVAKSRLVRYIEPKFGEAVRPNGARFLVVYFEAKLVGRETGAIDASQLTLLDNRNRIFDVDSRAMWALGEVLFFEQIHPGITVKGRVAFDLPRSSRGFILEIGDLRLLGHESGSVYLGEL